MNKNTPLLNAMEQMYIDYSKIHRPKYFLVSWQTRQKLLEECKVTLTDPPKDISSYRGVSVLTVMEFPVDRIDLV